MRRSFRRIVIVCMMFLVLGTHAAYAASTYSYLGSRLKGQDKKLYNELTSSWLAGKRQIEFELSGMRLRQNILEIVLDDNPRIFWMQESRLISSPIPVLNMTVLNFDAIPAWKGADSAKTRKTFDKAVKKAVNSLKKKARGKSAAQKAKLAHDYVIQHCVYRYNKYDQSAYGVLVNGKAVCAGYARAFKLLCDELGVPCICVDGYVKGQPHMVNYVKIKSKWYYVDTTRDDPGKGKRVRYSYFLLGSKQVRNYQRSSYNIALPKLAKNKYK